MEKLQSLFDYMIVMKTIIMISYYSRIRIQLIYAYLLVKPWEVQSWTLDAHLQWQESSGSRATSTHSAARTVIQSAPTSPTTSSGSAMASCFQEPGERGAFFNEPRR